MKTYINKLSVLLLALFTGAVLFSACSDDPVSANDDDPEIIGFVIQIEGVDIVTYQNGSYTFNNSSAVNEYVHNNAFMLSTSHNGGNLTRTSATEEEIGGRRYFTPSIFVRFIMDDGEVVELPQERASGASGDVSGDELNPDGPFRMNVSWDEPSMERGANIEQHGSDQSWGFHIRADHVGNAAMTLRVDRCDDVISLESVEGENHRTDQIRNCAEDEVTVFEASAPMPIVIDDYENAEDGAYPHNRFERTR